MILYGCTAIGSAFRFAKFDENMDVAAVYTVTPLGQPTGLIKWACDCPASQRPDCKHRKMVQRFVLAQAVNTERFYCYETQSWHTLPGVETDAPAVEPTSDDEQRMQLAMLDSTLPLEAEPSPPESSGSASAGPVPVAALPPVGAGPVPTQRVMRRR